MRLLFALSHILLGVFIIMFLVCITMFSMTLFSIVKSSPQEEKEKERQIFKVTAYCPCEKCCGLYADGITASGYRLITGNKLCAANFDFCTVLNIPGYGLATVLDRGVVIKENCIDVYFDTHQEALEWGVQYLKIGIVK